MIYEEKLFKRKLNKMLNKKRNQYHLSASQQLSPDKIMSDRLNRLSIGGKIERTLGKNVGDIVNKKEKTSNIQKTLEKIYKRMEDLTSGKLRQ